MKANWYLIKSGHLQKQPTFIGWEATPTGELRGRWFDIQSAEPTELREFLAPLHLPSIILDEFLNPDQEPKFFYFERVIFASIPVLVDESVTKVHYLAIIAQENMLATFHHGSIPAISQLANELMGEKKILGKNMASLFIQIIQRLMNDNASASKVIRDHIDKLLEANDRAPVSIDSGNSTGVGRQLRTYSEVIEGQLRCIVGLKNTYNVAFEPGGSKEYLEKLVMDAEIALRTAMRWETYLTNLRRDHRANVQERIEKRLRILTIVVVIFVPLSLIAGVFGVNTNTLPVAASPLGIAAVLGMIIMLALLLFWYFKQSGWFD